MRNIKDVFKAQLQGFKFSEYSVYRQNDHWSGNGSKVTDFIVENETGNIVDEIVVGKDNQMEAEIKAMKMNKGGE